jgi:DNA (cytosine-5)-methyltransferase 1
VEGGVAVNLRQAPEIDWIEMPSGVIVPESCAREIATARHRPIGVDLFAGCGGMSLGMHQAGLHVAAALEMDYAAACTYMVNLARPGVQIHFDTEERRAGFEGFLSREMGLDARGVKKSGVQPAMVAGSGWIRCFDDCDHERGEHEGVGYDGKFNDYLAEINRLPAHGLGCEHFWIADARTLTGAEILSALGLRRGDVDVVFGGPPCQGFSYVGKRNVMDPRNSLVFEFARLVMEINPKTLVMENVPGMATMRTPEGLNIVDALALVFEEGGFATADAVRRSLAGDESRRAIKRGAHKPGEKKIPPPAVQASDQMALFPKRRRAVA